MKLLPAGNTAITFPLVNSVLVSKADAPVAPSAITAANINAFI